MRELGQGKHGGVSRYVRWPKFRNRIMLASPEESWAEHGKDKWSLEDVAELTEGAVGQGHADEAQGAAGQEEDEAKEIVEQTPKRRKITGKDDEQPESSKKQTKPKAKAKGKAKPPAPAAEGEEPPNLEQHETMAVLAKCLFKGRDVLSKAMNESKRVLHNIDNDPEWSIWKTFDDTEQMRKEVATMDGELMNHRFWQDIMVLSPQDMKGRYEKEVWQREKAARLRPFQATAETLKKLTQTLLSMHAQRSKPGHKA